MRNAFAPAMPAVSSTQGWLAKPAVMSPLSNVSVAVSGTSVFLPPATVGVTVRGAATIAHPVGSVGWGGRHALSVRFDGLQEPITPPRLPPSGALPPSPDEPLVLPLPDAPPSAERPPSSDDEPLVLPLPDAPAPEVELPPPLLPAPLLPPEVEVPPLLPAPLLPLDVPLPFELVLLGEELPHALSKATATAPDPKGPQN